MNKTLRKALLFVVLALAVTSSAFGQATLRRTSLSAAVAVNDNSITVASATGIEVGDIAYVDNEAMRVRTITGTVLAVRRGQDGTAVVAHASGTAAYVDDPSYFTQRPRSGSCTSTDEVVLPVIHISSGTVYDCVGSLWVEKAAITGNIPWSKYSVTTLTTASALTYTAAQILGGLIARDPNGAGRTDTLPTAVLLVAAIPQAQVNTSFEFTVRNDADAAETITIAMGTGGTSATGNTLTIAQSNTKRFLVVLTNVTGGSEAYTVYSLGTVVH